jgi:multimeric flavodoxin WrbA
MTNPIIILGSSRSMGDTHKAVLSIIGDASVPIVDLKALNITPYDYDHLNQDDDYFPLMSQVATHDLIVLATPVYWYTMSATMKIFIDRLTDLLKIRKDLGRSLRGKRVFVISSFHGAVPKGFEDTFEQTCKYMGMEYLGTSFICSRADNPEMQASNDRAIERARGVLFA